MSFVKQLIRENKIKLVDESKNISDSYEIKSENSLKAAKLLYEQNLYEESTSMSYYAMYHRIISLFFELGIKCENHTGSIIILKEIFNINTADLEYAKKERIDKQYYTDFKITKVQTKEMFVLAENFCSELSLIKNSLNSIKKKALIEKFKKFYLV